MSIHFQQNTSGLQRALKSAENQENQKDWQENIKNAPNAQKAYKKIEVKSKKTNATNKTTASSAVGMRSFDDHSLNNGTGNKTISSVPDISKAESFNMDEDLKKFATPPPIDNSLLDKDNLWNMSLEVLDILDKSDATPALKKRAAYLLQEEQQIKSMINGYKNALIFS